MTFYFFSDLGTNTRKKLVYLLDCIDVSVYSPNGYSSDSIHDYTIPYSELSEEILDELVQLCRTYNEVMLEQEQE